MSEVGSPFEPPPGAGPGAARGATASRVSRFTRGAAANVLNQVINILGQVALVPVFLTVWGEQLYGEWLTLSAAVAYMSVLGWGVQAYVVNRLHQSYARQDLGAYTQILQSALHGCFVVSLVALCAVALGLAFAPIHEWFNLDLTGATVAAVVALLLALRVVASIPQGLVSGVYRTVGEYPRGTMVANGQRVAFIALTAGALALGAGLPAVAAVQLVPIAASVVYVIWDLARRHPEVHFGIRERSTRLAVSLIAPSSLFLVIQVSIAAALQGSTLIVGAVYGATTVAVFVTQRTLANLMRQAANGLSSVLWPEVTVLEAQGEFVTLRRVHLLAVKTLLSVSLASATFLHFGGQELFELWTAGRVAYDAPLMDAFLMLLVAQMPWLASSTFLLASNHHRVVAVCQSLSATLGLGLGYLWLESRGLTGLVYGLLVADLVICTGVIPWSACRLVQDRFWRYASQVALRAVPVALCLYGAAHATWAALAGASWPIRLISLGVVVAATAGSLGYTVYLDAWERQRLRGILRDRLRRSPSG